MSSAFWLAVAAYLLPTFPLGYFWHLKTFRNRYDRLAVYREPMIIPLGLSSMILQAFLFAWLYPQLFSTARDAWLTSALQFGAVFGVLVWTFATLSGQDSVPVLGPEDLSFNDMAQIVSEVLGKPVRYQQISFEAYKARFIERGMSEAMAQGMVDMAAAKNEGLDNAEPRTPENTTPTSFRQWCEEVLRPAALN